MRQDIDRAEQRSRQYWYEDGLVEIAAGCIFLAVGVLFLAEGLGALPSGASSLGLIVVVFAGMGVARRAVRWAKERITYPRTGYVRYRRPEGRRGYPMVTVAVGAGMAALVAALFGLAPASLAWIPALDGLLIGGFLLYSGHSLGLARFYLLALLSALVGVAASLGGLGDILGTGVYFAAMALALLLSGAIVLLRYLRTSRLSEGEGE